MLRKICSVYRYTIYRLEKLRGDRTGYWSLRIKDQWRIVFRWQDGDALDVEILDYHR